VLVVDRLTLTGLTITGLKGKIEPMAKINSIPVLIDQRILNDGRPHEHGTEITIDAAFMRDQALFGEDIRVGPPESLGQKLVVNAVESKNVRVEAAPSLRDVVHDDYEGKLSFTLNVKQVTLRGPKSMFEGSDQRIIVTVRRIEDSISRAQVTGDSGILRLSGVCEVQWGAGGIKHDPNRDLLRVTAEEFGSDPLSAREFQQRLVAFCQVKRKRESVRLQNVPIQIRYPVPQNAWPTREKFDLLEDYSVLSGFTEGALSLGEVPQLDVRVPSALARDKEFLSRLVVVLNVAEATVDLERLNVPFSLGLRGTSRVGDEENLLQVAMGDSVATFAKKR
jgi:hypothetical protein